MYIYTNLSIYLSISIQIYYLAPAEGLLLLCPKRERLGGQAHP